MQLIASVFLFLVVYSVLCSQTEETNNEEIRSASIFYDKLKELFQACNQNDTGRMEGIFKALETINTKELNRILDTNSTTNYARDLKNYVVK